MELQVISHQPSVNLNSTRILGTKNDFDKPMFKSPFIEANIINVSYKHLKEDCIIPVFAKDNEQTISHSEFVDQAFEVVKKVFPKNQISIPNIRVSHIIKGRTPDAMGVPVSNLRDNQKTIYYERMAFVLYLPEIIKTISGNRLMLTVGGVRAYNHENLYGKKGMQKFKFFIGFENMVCCNMCLSTDGYKQEIKSSSLKELSEQLFKVVTNYNYDKHVEQLKTFQTYKLSEHQFAQILGKSKLYQFLSKKEKKDIPALALVDNHFTSIAKDYYKDKSFCKDENGDIDLWRLYNLLTGANKSSYIDTFLDRGVNAFEFTQGISKAIDGDSQYRWFLS